jgi:hypothetical protein
MITYSYVKHDGKVVEKTIERGEAYKLLAHYEEAEALTKECMPTDSGLVRWEYLEIIKALKTALGVISATSDNISIENNLHINTLRLIAVAVEKTDSNRIICKSFISGNRAVVLAMHKKSDNSNEITEYVVWWYANEHTHTGHYTQDYASANDKFASRVNQLITQS